MIKKITLLASLLLLAFSLQAQELVQISGKVTDNSGDPLSGVTVIEKGTSRGTVSDAKGDFSLRVSSAEATISLHFIGMQSVDYPLKGNRQVTVSMVDESKLFDDVVVLGFGQSVSKSDLTGAISTVKSDVFDDKLVLSVEDALRGQVAGVRIATTDGEPGSDYNIRIRGTGSINATNAPLYVVDGLQMETLDVDPGDIQSMEILKDASATAIYGSRGANGVILITTKQGQKGKPSVTVDFKSSLQTPVRLIEMMDSYHHVKRLYDQQMDVSGNYIKRTGNQYALSKEGWELYRDSEFNLYLINPANGNANYADYLSGGTNTDWQEVMLRNAWIHNARVNVSGGDDRGTYSLMGNYTKQDGMLVYSWVEKMSLRANMDRKITANSSFGLNLNGTYSNQRGAPGSEGGSDGAIMSMLSQPPTKAPSEDSDEEDYETGYRRNPYDEARNIKKMTAKTSLKARLYFDLQLARDWKLSLTGNYTHSDNTTSIFYPKNVAQGRITGGKAQYNGAVGNAFQNENLLYYKPAKWGRHTFDSMLGAIFEQGTARGMKVSSQGFSVQGLGSDALQVGLQPLTPENPYTRTRMASFLSRSNYNYNDRYLLTASFRLDGSSRFGDDHRWGFFPSGAFSWRVIEEPWMRPTRKVLSNLKLRLSAGISGNTAIPALQSLAAMMVTNYPIDGESSSLGMSVNRIANKGLKWETSTQYDAGLDFGIFKNRLSGTVDVYYKRTRDLLFTQKIPYASGYTQRWSNLGAVDNKGLEITLNWTVLSRRISKGNKFEWSMSYNMSFNRSKVISLGEDTEMFLNPGVSDLGNIAKLEVGKPIGCWYGYTIDGVFRHQSQIDALPSDYEQNGTTKDMLAPGYSRFVDYNGDGTVNDKDLHILGYAEPIFTGGWNNTIKYSNFSLNIGIEFRYGGLVYNATRTLLTQLQPNNSNNMMIVADYWRPTLYNISPGDIVDQGNELTSTHRSYSSQSERFCSNRDLEDGSYLRLNDITLSYSFNKKLLAKVRMSKLSLFVSVRNAWVWSNYTGYDPDVNVAKGTYSDLAPSLDYAAYPRSRAYTAGINFTF